MFFKCMAHTSSANLAQYLGLNGTIMATSAACASSLQAIGTGYDLIRLGRQDLMFCGGAEEVHPTVTGIFDLLYATSANFNDTPELTPRPFDHRRDGLVCGEGAGVIILENYEHALARGAEIYAEIIGYCSNASGNHLSQSNQAAMVTCMQGCLDDAGISAAAIGYINAHATATLQGDAEEAGAIAEVFGDTVPVSSFKGHLGHTLGASGVLESIAIVKMLQDGTFYPGLNLEKPADDCSAIRHLRKPEQLAASVIMKNGFAFGGINACLLFEQA